MLDIIAKDGNPVVLALFPHGMFWQQEIRVVERAERDRDQPVELALDPVVNG
jgi:hypothetical protein